MANSGSLYDLIKPNETVILEGTLGFSRLKNPEDSLSNFNDDKVYTIQLVNPHIAKVGDYGLTQNGADTELGKHILDEGITHGAFRFKKGNNKGKLGWSFEIPAADDEHPKRRAPQILDLKNPNPRDAKPSNEFLDGELASGQTVLVEVQSFEYNYHGRKGTSMAVRWIGVEDASNIKYFSGSSNFNAFGNMFGNATVKSQTAAPKTATKTDSKSNDSDSDEGPSESDIENLFNDKN